jgi:hypothetical protein
MDQKNDAAEKVTAPPAKDPDTAAATERAAAKVPDAVDRAGDNTPTKPGAEAAKASSGLADHTKHPPGERAESAKIAITGSNQDDRSDPQAS